ncbi:MAG: NCS2 family permease [Bacillota bacterium]|nr:NCS2 family permease [Bacillota bacterium]
MRAAVFAATAISAAVTTLLMGLFGHLPVGLASALGPNSLIAYTVCLVMGFNFAQSMAIVLVDGIIFLIISLTPLRAWVIRSIPKSLKFAISAGIGFFIAFIGLNNMGVIVAGSASTTPVAMGDFTSLTVLLGLLGVIIVLVISSIPQKSKFGFWISKFAIIISLVFMGVLCASLGTAGVGDVETTFYDSSYHISEIGNISKLWGACFFGFDAFASPLAIALAFSLLFVDFFDTAGTLVGVEAGADLLDENGLSKVDDRPAMVVDAVGTCFGAICGTTTVSSFVESTTGVAAGARTGLASVVTGLLFALSLAIYPCLAMFSSNAVTGLALVYVGICMFKSLEKLEWHDFTALGSGFITILAMTLSYSISDGIAFGFITYTVMTLASGKFKKSDITVACCSLAFVAIYIVNFAFIE